MVKKIKLTSRPEQGLSEDEVQAGIQERLAVHEKYIANNPKITSKARDDLFALINEDDTKYQHHLWENRFKVFDKHVARFLQLPKQVQEGINLRMAHYKIAIKKNRLATTEEKENLLHLLDNREKALYKELPWSDRFSSFDQDIKDILKRNFLVEIEEDLKKEKERLIAKYVTNKRVPEKKKEIAIERIQSINKLMKDMKAPGYSVELLKDGLGELKGKMKSTGFMGSYFVTGAGKVLDMIKKVDKVLQEPKPEKTAKNKLRM